MHMNTFCKSSKEILQEEKTSMILIGLDDHPGWIPSQWKWVQRGKSPSILLFYLAMT
jgi:hypothetical protein